MQHIWTKESSAKAVAAKERRRIERALNPIIVGPRKFRMPKLRARFRLTIRDEVIADSLTLSLRELPWRGRFVSADGQSLSTRKVLGMVAAVLNSR